MTGPIDPRPAPDMDMPAFLEQQRRLSNAKLREDNNRLAADNLRLRLEVRELREQLEAKP